MKEKILELHKQGKNYNEIVAILECSKSLVCYYCGTNQKEKNNTRRRKYRKRNHPFKAKIEHFSYRKRKIRKYDGICKSNLKKQIRDKVYDFKIQGINMSPTFTMQDIIDKFGENPKCYLTGEDIDIYKPSTYEFDHIIPTSRGGDNSLDNLGIATKKANQSKRNMTPDELIFFCKKVLEYHKYQVKAEVEKVEFSLPVKTDL